MASQQINLSIDAAGTKKYLSSVTSLICRLPPFDFAEQNGNCHLRIKSENLTFAKHIPAGSKKAIGTEVVIIPTDDDRLKIIIIPMESIG